MNSTGGGLRPTVGLRRPGGCLLRRRRPTPGAERLRRPISIGVKASGQRSACAPNEFGLQGPSADGRPAPTGKGLFASAEADARRESALEGRFQSARKPTVGGWPVRRMNSASGGLRPAVGLRRPGGCLLRRRRPTPGAERLGRPISIGAKAYGRGLACAPNEFGLGRPSASGRPAPTGKGLFASAEADARRAAPWKADFNRREGLRPTVGLRRPEKRSLRRRRPTPGAQRLGRPISIGRSGFSRDPARSRRRGLGWRAPPSQ